jgi:hypothetical protein
LVLLPIEEWRATLLELVHVLRLAASFEVVPLLMLWDI